MLQFLIYFKLFMNYLQMFARVRVARGSTWMIKLDRGPGKFGGNARVDPVDMHQKNFDSKNSRQTSYRYKCTGTYRYVLINY